MKRYISYILIILCYLFSVKFINAQTIEHKVINTAGGILTATNGYTIEQNVGETFSTTLIANNKMLTQGFLQPLISSDSNMTGDTIVCVNSTGNIYTTELGMTAYTWSINGGTITAGLGTNSVTVTWDTAGTKNISVNYTNTNGYTATSPTVKNVIVKAAPSPVITGTPYDTYIVPKLAIYQYSTPLVAGNLYSWNSPKIEGYCSATARNCINVHFLDPCCVYGQWTINVTETNPITGCSVTATKLIYINP